MKPFHVRQSILKRWIDTLKLAEGHVLLSLSEAATLAGVITELQEENDQLREVVGRLLDYEDYDTNSNGVISPIDRTTLGWSIFTDDCREAMGIPTKRR